MVNHPIHNSNKCLHFSHLFLLSSTPQNQNDYLKILDYFFPTYPIWHQVLKSIRLIFSYSSAPCLSPWRYVFLYLNDFPLTLPQPASILTLFLPSSMLLSEASSENPMWSCQPSTQISLLLSSKISKWDLNSLV